MDSNSRSSRRLHRLALDDLYEGSTFGRKTMVSHLHVPAIFLTIHIFGIVFPFFIANDRFIVFIQQLVFGRIQILHHEPHVASSFVQPDLLASFRRVDGRQLGSTALRVPRNLLFQSSDSDSSFRQLTPRVDVRGNVHEQIRLCERPTQHQRFIAVLVRIGKVFGDERLRLRQRIVLDEVYNAFELFVPILFLRLCREFRLLHRVHHDVTIGCLFTTRNF